MREMAERNKILLIETGSQLYGTATPESDTDYSGIFIAPEEFYFGLDKVEEVDCSIISKNEDGKNNKDAVDKKFYEFRKFVRLAIDNNPNIISTLFVPDKNIVFINEFGRELLDNAHLFPWKGCYSKFKGYAQSQKKKMTVKPNNLKALIMAQKLLMVWLESGIKKGSEINLLRGNGCPDVLKFSDDFVAIGDLKFNLQVKIGDVLGSITTRIEKASHRADGFLAKGYDTKFASHLIRLLLECIELLATGKIQYPSLHRDTLLQIRQGKWELTHIMQYAESLENAIDVYLEKSNLPSKPQYDKVNLLLIKMVKEFHSK